jgi:flagellar motor switch protein FliN/FliY
MNTTNPQAEPDAPEEQLDRAIEELRGVLKAEEKRTEPGARPSAPAEAGASGSIIMNIPVDVQIVLGSAEMPVSELMALQKGSTVALNRRIGEPVDVVVNGRRIARGEITVLESDPSRFGIRLTEIVAAAKSA